MVNNLEKTIVKWLRLLNMKVSLEYIKEQLTSHPNYPSLVSVTDVLDGLKIDNVSLVVDKNNWSEIPTPFLAHVNSGYGGFVLVEKIPQAIRDNPNFLSDWDGIAVLAEKPTNFYNKENELKLQKETKAKKLRFSLAVSMILLTYSACFYDLSWILLLFLSSSVIGFLVSVLTVQHDLGIQNNFTDQLCSVSKNSDCDLVLSSRNSKLLNYLNFSDLSLIWFSSSIAIAALATFTQFNKSIWPIAGGFVALSIPVTFYSLYFQWKVVKKWCTLCLLTIGMLWLQVVALLPVLLNTQFQLLSFQAILFSLFIISSISIFWLLVAKPSLVQVKNISDNNAILLRLKSDPDTFVGLLKQQRKVDTTPFDDDLQIGNSNSVLQLTVSCSLFCGPCTKAHQILHEITEEFDIGLTIRFFIPENKEDKRRKSAEYVLKLLNGKNSEFKRTVLHDWYNLMDFEKFQKRYPLVGGLDITDQIENHTQWFRSSKIESTPTIFINGHLLPSRYDLSELSILLDRLSDVDGAIQKPLKRI